MLSSSPASFPPPSAKAPKARTRTSVSLPWHSQAPPQFCANSTNTTSATGLPAWT